MLNIYKSIREITTYLSARVPTRAFLLIIFSLSFLQLALKTRGEYLSPWDEMYHFSYIQYIYDWHLPHSGDPLNTWSREGFSCNKVWPFGYTTTIECGQIAAPSFYPEGGSNTAAIWPPIYYILVSLILHIFSFIGAAPLWTAKYATAAIWSTGLVLISKFLLKVNVSRRVTFAFALMMSSATFAIFHGAFVTPHSAVPMTVGSLLLTIYPIIYTKDFSTKRFAILLSVASLSVLTIPHAISTVGIIVLTLFMVLAIDAHTLSVSKRTYAIVASVFIFLIPVAVTKLWEKLQESRATQWGSDVDLAQAQGSVLGLDPVLSPQQWVEAIWRFFPHSIDGYQFQAWPSATISGLISYLLIGGIFSAIFTLSKNKNSNFLALSTLVIGIVFSLYLEKILIVAVSPRYGLSIVVMGLAVAMTTIRNKLGKNLFLICSSSLYIFALFVQPFRF